MEKIGLEKLKTIKALNLSKAMTSTQEEALNYEIDLFIENLPDKTMELMKLSVANDYEALQAKLRNMAIVLNGIYAADAAQKCIKLAGLLKGDVTKSRIGVHLEELISELNTLSIDIQTIQYKKHDDPQKVEHIKHDTKTQKDILAVDDDPVILNVLKKVIDGEKYKFIGAASGKTALKYLETHAPLSPALIISDIEMPEMDGYQFVESIMAKKYGIPIIFLTSNATRDHIMKAMQMGVADFLVKPVSEDLILNKLDGYLK